MKLELLGGIDLQGPPREEADRLLAQPKLVALLAYLALATRERGARYHRRDTLVALLWPELDQTHARTALRKAVHAIRSALGADILLSRGDEELALADAVQCDAVAFVDDIETNHLARAMEHYRGDLMPGFHLAGCVEFDRWLDDARTDLRERAGAASLALAQAFEKDAALTVATHWARRAARFSWNDERVLRRALALLDRAGDRSGALRLYEEFVVRLKADFDAEPAPETAALMRELTSRDSPGQLR